MARTYGTEREPFSSAKVSPSRIESFLQCGVAFERKYIQREPEQASGSAALFGNVFHHAAEKWGPNRSADFLVLMKNAWLAVTEGTSVNDFIGAYQGIAVEVIRAEHECKLAFEKRTKKPSKAIHMSGEWKKHPVKKKIDRLLAEWLPRLEAESPWRFTESDPIVRLYNESLVLARRYEERWRHLPSVLYAEFSFDVKWNDFLLNGYIDTVEPLVDRETGELLALGIVDYKTYKKAGPPQKDWRQRVMYYIAFRELVARGSLTLPPELAELPVLVGMDYVRWADTEDWKGIEQGGRVFKTVTEADEARFLLELSMYRNAVNNEVFLPAEKGRNVDFCPYPENCCLQERVEGQGQEVELNV